MVYCTCSSWRVNQRAGSARRPNVRELYRDGGDNTLGTGPYMCGPRSADNLLGKLQMLVLQRPNLQNYVQGCAAGRGIKARAEATSSSTGGRAC